MFKINGIKELTKQLNALDSGSKKAINKGIQKTARLILSSALAKIKVEKALLKSSMGIELMPDAMKAKVFASALHAAYVEFGTGAFVQVPVGLEAYAMEFFVNGKGVNRPYPFLFPALFENQDKLVPLIEAELILLLK